MSWLASGVRERGFCLGITRLVQVRCVDPGGGQHRVDAVRVDPKALRPPTLHQQHLQDEVSQGTTTRRCRLFPFFHTSWHHKIEEPNLIIIIIIIIIIKLYFRQNIVHRLKTGIVKLNSLTAEQCKVRTTICCTTLCSTGVEAMT